MTAFAAGPRPQPKTLLAPVRRTPQYLVAFRAVLYFFLFMTIVWGGPVIRAAALCALPLALLGDWAGGVRQILRLVGLALAGSLAVALGPAVGGVINSVFNVPPVIGTVTGLVLLVLIAIVSVGALSRGITRWLKGHPHLKATDHILGGLAGTAEGALLVAVGCWLLTAFAMPIEALRYRLSADEDSPSSWVINTMYDMSAVVRGDQTGRWLTRTNPLEKIPAVQTAQLVSELAADPGRVLKAIEAGDLGGLAELPDVKRYVTAFENDPVMKEALRRGDVSAIIRSSHVRAMLHDRALHRALLAHRDEIRRAIGQPDYAQLKAEARQLDSRTRREMRNLAKRSGD